MTIHSLPHLLWQRIPRRLRSYFAIEPLRLCLPKARNVVSETGPYYIVGFFSAPTGLGQSARLFFQEKKQQGFETHAVDMAHLSRVPPLPDLHRDALLPLASLAEHAGPGRVVLHLNPPTYMAALWSIRRLLPGKRVIAYWAWELEDVPHAWTRCLDHLDEVLAPSRFVADAISRHTDKPVSVHPPAALPVVRHFYPMERPFTVLSCFDFGSNFCRKNPLAAVAAFKAAFGDSPEAQLVLKAGNADYRSREWRQLLQAADSANIRFCLAPLSTKGMADLYAECDAYLSLHRSEGYGLTIQEAMQHGLHVIATDWSGNRDFMRGEQCHAVPCSLVPVRDPEGVYSISDAVWAEPDVKAAAELLRAVRERVRERAWLGKRAEREKRIA